MILDRYQLEDEIEERGYSATAKVTDNQGVIYFAKWLKGISRDSLSAKILIDKLRHLKKVEHRILPEIIEYAYDKERKSYCIIYKCLEAISLKEVDRLNPQTFLKGIGDIVEGLQHILQYNITHEDIHPDNILIDKNHNFYLIDIGLSRITSSLSQESSIEIFAKRYAAPEKFDKTIKGFPYQSDIYSVGKILEEYFYDDDFQSEFLITTLKQLVCQKPSNRLNYGELTSILGSLKEHFKNDCPVSISFKHRTKFNESFVEELNSTTVKYSVYPKKGENIMFDFISKSYHAHCLWLLSETEIKVLDLSHKEEEIDKWKSTDKYSTEIGLHLSFIQDYRSSGFNLAPCLNKLVCNKTEEKEYSRQRRVLLNDLKFYEDLLNKEMDVMESNSLRIHYKKFEKKGNGEIWFYCDINKKYSSEQQIEDHVFISVNPRVSNDFEYILNINALRTIEKKPCKFHGVAYNWMHDKNILKFRDCEGLIFDRIPSNGFLFENVAVQKEEKKRQLDAIRKVKNNEAQSRLLMSSLFNPHLLTSKFVEYDKLDVIYQKDKDNIDFKYSYNQVKAITNAIEQKPLSVIQGPPGTGKTTVITEIVFQLLHKEPDCKILITSQTNDAVDNVLENLLKNRVPFVRLCGKKKPQSDKIKLHTLDRKIEGWKKETIDRSKSYWGNEIGDFKKSLANENPVYSAIIDLVLKNSKWNTIKPKVLSFIEKFNLEKKLIESSSKRQEFTQALNKHLKFDLLRFVKLNEIQEKWRQAVAGLDENSAVNQKLVDSIQVVGATTNHIAAKKYTKYYCEFDYVIMDESGKATVAESLVPLVMANNAILVGDHRQLRPMLTSNKEVEKWLGKKYKEDCLLLEERNRDDYINRASLFENIIEGIDDTYKSQLTECRRSSAQQIKLISDCFYTPFGDEPIEFVKRNESDEHNLPLNIESSVIFYDIGNHIESKTDSSRSSKNVQSAKVVLQLLKGLDNYKKMNKYSLGVISGYKAQVREINKLLSGKRNFRNINRSALTVSVVDKFQGLEKDIIIFDLVRAKQKSLGFLANANRINVALSRQKKLLIIVGDYNGILNSQAPKNFGKGYIALHKYLKMINKNHIITDCKQLF